MQLPNGDQAVVPLEKLVEYCLNPDHPRGRHKARVFAASLGITAAEADRLQSALLAAAVSAEAIPGESDDFGRRFVIDLMVQGSAGRAMVRSSWIIRRDEEFPRLTSCFVL